jgi:chromosome partitioning protein
MRVIACCSQKGGSGKTTLAGHIAVQAELAGAGPVAIVDTDPQGSLADWWNERKAEAPAFAHTFVSRIGEDLARLRELGIKLCVVDTPPAITTTIEQVIEVADLVVIPCRPSPHDLRAAGATVELVERLGKKLVFVINAATPRARITAEAAIALSQHGTLAPVTVHQRTDYAASMIDGRTVMEVDGASASAEEMVQLWEYLNDRLTKTVSTMKFSLGNAQTTKKGFGSRGTEKNAL